MYNLDPVLILEIQNKLGLVLLGSFLFVKNVTFNKSLKKSLRDQFCHEIHVHDEWPQMYTLEW